MAWQGWSSVISVYPGEMKIITLILKRLIRKLGLSVFTLVVVPIIIVVVLNLVLLLAVYVECWVFGTVSYRSRFTGASAMVCLSR